MNLPNKDLLIGWKEIASYLIVSERTALRYFKDHGLPIKKDRIGHPVISKLKVDKWRIKTI